MSADEPAAARPVPLPAGYEDYAGEIVVANGKPPRWMARVPQVAILLALGYYGLVRISDPVNLAFAALFLVWLIYTPIAQKRGWFFIPM
ncbi:MAG: hypothetical protein IT317_14135 [Anaerolineales bacterium]|nr:hypothetical protein [Anaerolineales bacterium]